MSDFRAAVLGLVEVDADFLANLTINTLYLHEALLSSIKTKLFCQEQTTKSICVCKNTLITTLHFCKLPPNFLDESSIFWHS